MKTVNNYEVLSTTPLIPDSVYENLPPFLKEITDNFSESREKDIVLTSCLTILSGCFSGIKGRYGKDSIASNLFTFIVAPPASMKNSMKYSLKLGEPIQENFEEENAKAHAAYESEYREWKALSKKNATEAGDPPPKPKYPILFAPGNSSAAALYWLLDESDGKVIICETEADSLTGAIHQDWGNYSYLLRNAYHHETVAISRKGDKLYLRIKFPQLSVLLTGTPDQVSSLISSTEDGLCSRFLFYCFSQEIKWIDQTPCLDCIDYSAFFIKKGYEVAKIKKQLEERDYVFNLTSEQFKTLNANFSRKINVIKMFEGNGASSAVKRLAVIAFRIAMILTVLRKKDSLKDKLTVECSDEDFITVMSLVEVYFEHSMVMYSLLPKQFKVDLGGKIREFYTHLPSDDTFPRKQANEVGDLIGISERTVGNYLDKLTEKGYLTNPEYGNYLKIGD